MKNAREGNQPGDCGTMLALPRMLPDYPELKQDIMNRLHEYLRLRLNEHLGFFGDVPRTNLLEGDRSVIVRADETEEEFPFHEVEAVWKVQESEVPGLTLQTITTRLDELASELASSQKQTLLSEMDKAASHGGSVVKGDGRPTAEIMLEAMESMRWDFTHGEPDLALIIHPSQMSRIRDAKEELEGSSELQQRHAELKERKHREWALHEAGRKLVG